MYLLVATVSVEGAAANLISAQAVSPPEFLDAVRRKLPRPDRERGTELLEGHLATLDAYLRGAEQLEALTRIVSKAADRETAVREIASLLNLSETQAYAVGDMPLDMATRGGLEALEAERQDLTKRLNSIRSSAS